MQKKLLIFIILGITLALIVVVSAIRYNQIQTIKCIGENSKLFVQPGSRSCQEQIEILGKDIEYINVIDCFSERDKCDEIEISKTPVWIIQKEKYDGYTSVDEFYSDGVAPVGFELAKNILKKTFKHCSINDVDYRSFVP